MKRLGYVVTRAKPPSVSYPATPSLATVPKVPSIARRILSLFPKWFSWLSRLFKPRFNWWKPLRIGGWLHRDIGYRMSILYPFFDDAVFNNPHPASIFKSLRFMPSGHKVPLITTSRQSQQTPYEIFFHLYKPSTPFRKSAPPAPDFSIVVVK